MAKRGRIPRPWFRKTTGTWYVTLNGKQIPLGKTKREAVAEFARVMADEGRAVTLKAPTLGQLVDLWLADRKRAIKPITYESYERIAGSWAEFAGGLQAADLRPYHAHQWLDRSTLGQSTRSLRITVIRAITRWAVDMGYLDRDPLTRLKPPEILRRSPVTLEQFEQALARASPTNRELLTVLVLTGIRPGELASLAVENIDLVAGQAIVTGKSGVRSVQLSAAACEVLGPLMARAGKGKLWPGFESKHVSDRIRWVGKQAGLTKFSAHRIRGLYATEAIRRRVDSLLVSQLLGHKDPSIVAKHYASPDQSMMREAADQASIMPPSDTSDRKRKRK